MSVETQPDIVHDSIRPSRGGMPGETAFLSAWQELMASLDPVDDDEADDHPLHGVHSLRWSRRPAIDQADATMAATLIQWLGTQAGACLIQQARRLMDAGLSGPDAYRAAWAVTNKRKQATNSELRTIETLMIPVGEPCGMDGVPHKAPRITPRQYETAEHVCAWLGTASGRAFVETCEREIEAYNDHERARQRDANRNRASMPMGLSQQGVADYLRILRRATAAARAHRGAA